MVDINAAIVPGESSAGFRLGQKFDEVASLIKNLSEWTYAAKWSLSGAISSTPEWLRVPLAEVTGGERNGELLCFGKGMVCLQFGAGGELYSISVEGGYSGLLWGEIKIGDELSLVRKRCGLEYDRGDEMHYPIESSGVKGIAFYAEECSLEDEPNQIISVISVHDWALDR